MLWRATLSAGHCHLNLTAICGNWSGSICSGLGGGFAQGLGKICRFRTGFLAGGGNSGSICSGLGGGFAQGLGKICRFRTGFLAGGGNFCRGCRLVAGLHFSGFALALLLAQGIGQRLHTGLSLRLAIAGVPLLCAGLCVQAAMGSNGCQQSGIYAWGARASAAFTFLTGNCLLSIQLLCQGLLDLWQQGCGAQHGIQV